jgi:hypothetical protein
VRWRVRIEAAVTDSEAESAARRVLERFNGQVEVDGGDRLRVSFELESPSAKRAAKVAFVIFGRAAGRNEPTRFEVIRIE